MPKKKIEETNKEELKEDINKNLKEELLEELNIEIDNKIKIAVNNELDKTNKKIIKSKNRKLFFKNIIIIILLVLIVYLLYLLKTVHYFDKYFISDNVVVEKETSKEETNEKKEEPVKENKPSLNELKEKYASLLNNIYLNESSKYINVFYEGNLTNEIKQYFVINSLKELPIEEDYNIIDNNSFKKEYEKLFDDEYVPINFEYNDNLIRYISKLEAYLSDKLITKNNTSIVKEIIKITESDNEIKITTIEGLKREDKVFNILTKEEVCEEKEILKNESKLNKITYIFNKDNKLIKIEK